MWSCCSISESLSAPVSREHTLEKPCSPSTLPAQHANQDLSPCKIYQPLSVVLKAQDERVALAEEFRFPHLLLGCVLQNWGHSGSKLRRL